MKVGEFKTMTSIRDSNGNWTTEARNLEKIARTHCDELLEKGLSMGLSRESIYFIVSSGLHEAILYNAIKEKLNKN